MKHSNSVQKSQTKDRSRKNDQQSDHRNKRPTTPQNRLQGLIGNQSVQSLQEQGSLQQKLVAGSRDSPAEKNAELVAEHASKLKQVDGNPRPEKQAKNKKQTDVGLETTRLTSSSVTTNRSTGELLSDNASAIVKHSLQRGGRKLPSDTRGRYETIIGADFSDVRVHTGSLVDKAAKTINAEAYTIGSDIGFAKGKYRLDSEGGSKLIAHELAHVAQQPNLGSRQSTVWRGMTQQHMDWQGGGGGGEHEPFPEDDVSRHREQQAPDTVELEGDIQELVVADGRSVLSRQEIYDNYDFTNTDAVEDLAGYIQRVCNYSYSYFDMEFSQFLLVFRSWRTLFDLTATAYGTAFENFESTHSDAAEEYQWREDLILDLIAMGGAKFGGAAIRAISSQSSAMKNTISSIEDVASGAEAVLGHVDLEMEDVWRSALEPTTEENGDFLLPDVFEERLMLSLLEKENEIGEHLLGLMNEVHEVQGDALELESSAVRGDLLEDEVEEVVDRYSTVFETIAVIDNATLPSPNEIDAVQNFDISDQTEELERRLWAKWARDTKNEATVEMNLTGQPGNWDLRNPEPPDHVKHMLEGSPVPESQQPDLPPGPFVLPTSLPGAIAGRLDELTEERYGSAARMNRATLNIWAREYTPVVELLDLPEYTI